MPAPAASSARPGQADTSEPNIACSSPAFSAARGRAARGVERRQRRPGERDRAAGREICQRHAPVERELGRHAAEEPGAEVGPGEAQREPRQTPAEREPERAAHQPDRARLDQHQARDAAPRQAKHPQQRMFAAPARDL